MAKHRIISDYLVGVMDPKLLKDRVRELQRKLKPHCFEAIAFSGTSGAALAFPLSLAMKKPLLLVRKDVSYLNHHSSCLVEGALDAKTYVIVDDFVSSGGTIKHIARAVTSTTASKMQLVGVALYHNKGRSCIANEISKMARNEELGCCNPDTIWVEALDKFHNV